MNYFKHRRIILIFFWGMIFLLNSCSSLIGRKHFLNSLNAPTLLDAYEVLDSRINGGQGYSNHLDTIGYLSWRESRILDSYLNVYKLTKDNRWIDKFVSHADLILSHRDDHLFGKGPTWSSLKYLRAKWRKPEPLLVNNAMIVYPLARFASMVLLSESLNAYQNVALWYLDNVKKTVDYFNKSYVVDGNIGYYLISDEEFAKHPGINAPFNSNAAIGKVFLALYDATGEKRYLTRAKSLAETLKAGLEIAPNSSYRWYYWFGAGYEKYKGKEDVSHGALDVQFAVKCYEHDIVFKAEDIHRFATTLKKNIWDGKEFTSNVWGTGKVETLYADTGILWACVGRYDHEVVELIEKYILAKDIQQLPEYKWNWYMLAISELLLIKALLPFVG